MNQLLVIHKMNQLLVIHKMIARYVTHISDELYQIKLFVMDTCVRVHALFITNYVNLFFITYFKESILQN